MRLIGIWILTLAIACAAAPNTERASEATVAQPTGAARWINRATAAHAAADAAQNDSARLAATDLLTSAATADTPAAFPARELTAARLDLYGHAAELSLQLQDWAQALKLAKRGLALPGGTGPFRTQLHIVTARAYAALGDTESATQARIRARESLD